MRKSGITAVTLTLALLPALLAGCGTSRARVPGAAGNTGPEKTALVVAAVPAESASGLYIAQAQGLFTRQGLHVTSLRHRQPGPGHAGLGSAAM